MPTSIKLLINGREATEENLPTSIEGAILQHIKQRFEQSLQNVTCPEHNQEPQIQAEGTSMYDLKWYVSGCCQKVIDEVHKVLPLNPMPKKRPAQKAENDAA